MKRLLAPIVGILVTACSSTPSSPVSPASTIPEAGKWFCQMAQSGKNWDCVQDDQLAENPQPTRLPEPTPQAIPSEPADPAVLPDNGEVPPGDTRPLGDTRPRPEPAPAPPPVQPPPPQGPSPPGAADTLAPVPAAAADAATDLPEYARLAYQPPEPVPLTELPGQYYAVQLIAMSSRDALEKFAARERIHNVSAARVESHGELFYVLLLGIYETYAIARQALDSMPTVSGAEPWIRPLRSLQAAMRRADEASGSSRY